MFWLVQLLIPISICVVLPVLIVWIVFRSSTKKDQFRADIMVKALETNSSVDVDRLIEAFAKQRKTPAQLRNGQLLRFCIFTFLGIAFGIMSIIIGSMYDLDSAMALIFLTIIFIAIGLAYGVAYRASKKQEIAEEVIIDED